MMTMQPGMQIVSGQPMQLGQIHYMYSTRSRGVPFLNALYNAWPWAGLLHKFEHACARKFLRANILEVGRFLFEQCSLVQFEVSKCPISQRPTTPGAGGGVV